MSRSRHAANPVPTANRIGAAIVAGATAGTVLSAALNAGNGQSPWVIAVVGLGICAMLLASVELLRPALRG